MIDKSERLWDRIFTIIWLVFCAVYYIPDIISGKLVPSSSIWYFERQIQWLPFMEFVAHCLHKRIFPAWSPHFYLGFPYLAYPPNHFYFGSVYLYMLVDSARNFFIVHYIGFSLGGYLFYRALRKLSISPYGSFFGMLTYMGGSYFNILSAYSPYSMFTLVVLFWAGVSLIRDDLRLRNFVIFAIIFAFGLTYDLEQDFYFSIGLFVLYLLSAKPPKIKRLLLLGTGAFLGLLFQISTILNLASYGQFSVRSAGITFSHYIGYSQANLIKLKYLLTLLLPLVGKSIPPSFRAGYVGIIALITAFYGIKKLKTKGLLAISFLVLVLLYVFDYKPLMQILYHIPIINRFALHYSAGVVLATGFAILSGFGAEELAGQKSKLGMILIILTCLLIGTLGLFIEKERPVLLFIISLGAIYLLIPKLKKPDWLWQVVLILALLFDLVYPNFKHQPRANKEAYYPSPLITNYLAQEKRLVRFWPVSKFKYADTYLHPLVGMYLPLNLPGTHSPLGYWRVPPMRCAKLINLITPGYLIFDEKGRIDMDISKATNPKSLDQNDIFYLKFLNVGNVISRGVELNIIGLKKVRHLSDFYFYKLENPLPRFWLVSKVKNLSAEQAFTAIKEKAFNPLEVALIEEKIDFVGHKENQGKIRAIKFLPGKWEFEALLPTLENVPKDKLQYFLVVGENYFPGWRAFANGKEIKVIRADYTYMGIALPPGRHIIKLIYFPYATRIGLWIQLAGVGFWLLVLLSLPFRKSLKINTL